MWEMIKIENSKNHMKFGVKEHNIPVSTNRFLERLKTETAFVRWYNQQLAECPFDAFFWENRPMSQSKPDTLYECCLVKSDFLSRVTPDARSFGSKFNPDCDVVVFPNLGGDATLVVPCPVSEQSIYSQIGHFVRHAPQSQIENFWSSVGDVMLQKTGSEPRWLSTSGLGVYWLHVRIDTRPKYYQTVEYKDAEY